MRLKSKRRSLFSGRMGEVSLLSGLASGDCFMRRFGVFSPPGKTNQSRKPDCPCSWSDLRLKSTPEAYTSIQATLGVFVAWIKFFSGGNKISENYPKKSKISKKSKKIQKIRKMARIFQKKIQNKIFKKVVFFFEFPSCS